MVVARSVQAVVAAGLLAAVAGCATTTRANLASSADRLQQNAELLSQDEPYEPARGVNAFARDTHVLASDAQDFRRTVEDRRADDPDIRAAFDRLSRSYHAVRDEVDHTESLQARRDFRPVMDSYRDIEHELGLYPDREARVD